MDGRQLERVVEALLAAFPTESSLAQLVRYKLDENLNAITTAPNLRAQVFDLVDWAQARGRLDALLAGAARLNSGNPALAALGGSGAIDELQTSRLPAPFREQQQNAYQELWTRLEEIHLCVRTDTVTQAGFDSLLTDFNSFLIRKSLYLEAADNHLANRFLEGINILRQKIQASGDAAAQRAWSTTQILAGDDFTRSMALRDAAVRVDEAHDALLKRVRGVIQGTA